MKRLREEKVILKKVAVRSSGQRNVMTMHNRNKDNMTLGKTNKTVAIDLEAGHEQLAMGCEALAGSSAARSLAARFSKTEMKQ